MRFLHTTFRPSVPCSVPILPFSPVNGLPPCRGAGAATPGEGIVRRFHSRVAKWQASPFPSKIEISCRELLPPLLPGAQISLPPFFSFPRASQTPKEPPKISQVCPKARSANAALKLSKLPQGFCKLCYLTPLCLLLLLVQAFFQRPRAIIFAIQPPTHSAHAHSPRRRASTPSRLPIHRPTHNTAHLSVSSRRETSTLTHPHGAQPSTRENRFSPETSATNLLNHA